MAKYINELIQKSYIKVTYVRKRHYFCTNLIQYLKTKEIKCDPKLHKKKCFNVADSILTKIFGTLVYILQF